MLDIAAAAVKMVQAAEVGGDDGRQIPAVTPLELRPPSGTETVHAMLSKPAHVRALNGSIRTQRRDALSRIHIGAGCHSGIRPGDLVEAITGEAGVDSRALGAIEIGDRHSIVEVPE